MLIHPQPDPIAFGLGPVQVHWYGLMYLAAFLSAWWLGRTRVRQAWRNWTPAELDDLIFYGALGVILGGRIGYTLFYNFDAFIANPLWIFKLWTGGMSFHGGFLGVMIALALFCRRYNKSYWDVVDFTAPLIPVGLFTGRIGNFINAELPGRAADPDAWWSMVYPQIDAVARHPSQLYQAFSEGILLFIIVWFFSWRPRPRYAVSGVFALGYGSFRFITEFFREPDAHIGFVAFDWLTMGQLLSLPLVAVGVFLLVLAYRKRIMPVLTGDAPK